MDAEPAKKVFEFTGPWWLAHFLPQNRRLSLGESHVESLEFGQLETATSLSICRMCVILIIVYAKFTY